MSITIRKSQSGGWEVDLHVQRANGERLRERKRLERIPHEQVKSWAETRHAHLLAHGREVVAKEVLTLAALQNRVNLGR